MAIQLDEIQRIARLARLDLPDHALEKLTDDVGRILEHVQTLQEVDVEGVPATAHGVELSTALRPDEPTTTTDGEALLAGVPSRVGDGVSVPRIIE